jgi:Ser/Thr protein kinase RdoA (MazF antagonist)
VARLLGDGDRRVVADALRFTRRSTAALANMPRAWGLIHADLHYENFLFHGGGARAIDFDDCGWGALLYDLAVPLSELEGRSNYESLRDALLEGYARRRALPNGYGHHLDALTILRRVQLITWILESRKQAAFRHSWRSWARRDVRALAGRLRGLAS